MDVNLIVVALLVGVPVGYWSVLNEWLEEKAKAEAAAKAKKAAQDARAYEVESYDPREDARLDSGEGRRTEGARLRAELEGDPAPP